MRSYRFTLVLLFATSGCTSTSVSRRESHDLPIVPLIAAPGPGRLEPNDYTPNKNAFDVVKLPEAWWYLAAFGNAYVSKGTGSPTLFPTVLVADDGFYGHRDSPVDGSKYAGFGIYSDSGGKGSGTNVHGEHGTEVLSVLGAIKNNGKLVSGVAGLWKPSQRSRKTTVMDYGLIQDQKTNVTVDSQWSFGSKFVVAGITGSGLAFGNAPNPKSAARAITHWLSKDQNLKVINLSQDYMNLPGSMLTEFRAALRKAEQAGVTVITGAGNNGEIRVERGVGDNLDRFSNLITVGALNSSGTDYLSWKAAGHAQTSARGDAVDIFAPGQLMMVDNIGNTMPASNAGTSFAAPLVAGVVAMMYTLNPKITPRMIRKILMATADDVEISGETVFRINAYKALYVADNINQPVYRPFRDR